MPNRDTRRKAKKNHDNLGITINHEGRRYDIDILEFSALDEMDFEDVTGLGILQMASLMSDISQIKLKHLAALIWIARRAREPNLAFRDVAASVRFGDIEEMLTGDKDAEPVPPA